MTSPGGRETQKSGRGEDRMGFSIATRRVIMLAVDPGLLLAHESSKDI